MNFGVINWNKLCQAENVRFLQVMPHFDILSFLHLLKEFRCRSRLMQLWVHPALFDDLKLRSYMLLNYLFMLILELEHIWNSQLLCKLHLKRWCLVSRPHKSAELVKTVDHLSVLGLEFWFPHLTPEFLALRLTRVLFCNRG